MERNSTMAMSRRYWGRESICRNNRMSIYAPNASGKSSYVTQQHYQQSIIKIYLNSPVSLARSF